MFRAPLGYPPVLFIQGTNNLAYSTNLKKIRVVALSPGANVIKLYTAIIVAVS